ncbi:MAG: hypothetical protein SNJ72_03320 [Fimbriimonadales bacterium]
MGRNLWLNGGRMMTKGICFGYNQMLADVGRAVLRKGHTFS